MGSGVMSPYFLTDTLNRALQLVQLPGNEFLENISVVKTNPPRKLVAYSLQAFSWLSLTYKVPLHHPPGILLACMSHR